ncbi:conserved hypothetical protein [Flavobacterium psychrophilum]|uniref:hypothetical protein n=1 Tax=Flavobacterium psychrophilum TaxID=96345 RepID=UPI000B7C4EE5|nr:hypothetical protein [Flavobacterium psychrophilum]GEJ32479.1 hypothetical protein FPN184_contig00019-0002 [Flavobacterium psychrophilum]GEJ50408.1 hypothetical protein FPKKA176_contig00100-0002 [Flavobacterium psychrophilum]SNB10154.1 conserved hypothetical protein [Flavobacterium psychrophilum]
MKHTEKHLENSADKEYYKKQISKLTDNQKEEFESLVIRLENAGAKNPLSWANSEVSEKIPQFGRFLVLKSLFDIARSTEDNISMAVDFDEDIEDKFEEIKEKVGQEKLFDFLKSYSKGMIYNIIGLLDEGNLEVDRDKISWALLKTDDNFEPTGQIIQGLHEDFLEFENEIK